MWAADDPGGGVVFRFTVPVAKVDRSIKPAAAAALSTFQG